MFAVLARFFRASTARDVAAAPPTRGPATRPPEPDRATETAPTAARPRIHSGVRYHAASADRSQADGHAKPGPGLAAADAADPPVRRTLGDALPEPEDRRVLPPLQRPGVGRRRLDRRPPRGRLRHHRLPRPRPRPGPRHGAEGRHGRDARQGRPAARRARAGRCTSSTPRRASSAATRSSAATSRSPPASPSPSSTSGERPGLHLLLRRRRDGPGVAPRGVQHGLALEAAGHLRRREQHDVDGHAPPPALVDDRPDRPRRPRLRDARRPRRRQRHRGDGPRHPRGRRPRPRRRGADVHRGQDLPVPRPLDERPDEVPHQGRGRQGQGARPDRPLRDHAEGARLDRRGGARRDARGDPGRGRRGDRRSPRTPPSPTPEALYEDITVAPYIPQE